MDPPTSEDPLAVVANPGGPAVKNTNTEDSTNNLQTSNHNLERSENTLPSTVDLVSPAVCQSSTCEASVSRPPSPCMESPSTSCRQKEDPQNESTENKEDGQGQSVTSVEQLMEQIHGEDDIIDELVTPSKSELVNEEDPLIKTPPRKRPKFKTASPTSLSKTSKCLTFPAAKTSSTRMSKTRRAGLVFSVAKIHQRLKKGRYAPHVGTTGAVVMAAVLEYLVAEVLELAGNCAKYLKKKRVFPRCIQLTLLHDKELEQLTKGTIIPEGGVRPFIHPELLPPKDSPQYLAPQFSASRGSIK